VVDDDVDAHGYQVIEARQRVPVSLHDPKDEAGRGGSQLRIGLR
jgi:hypothetical protein